MLATAPAEARAADPKQRQACRFGHVHSPSEWKDREIGDGTVLGAVEEVEAPGGVPGLNKSNAVLVQYASKIHSIS